MNQIILNMKKKIISKSAVVTMEFGKRLGKILKGGEVLGLIGELGAGKTTFVKGIAKGLGVNEQNPVNSPSFVLMREYEGRIPLYHFDAHRLTDASDLLRLQQEIGLEEYLYGKGVSVLEWADRIESLLPREYLRIEFHHSKKNERVLTFHPEGLYYEKLVSSFKF